jgi:putative ABC transport system substrate-binding protein
VNRRRLILASIVVACHPAIGAARPSARVGYLELVKSSDGEMLYREFVEGLQSHGYMEGRNLQMLRRSAGAMPERLFSLAPELAAAKVDVILAASAQAARSAKLGAPGIPTVFVISSNPVVEGLVASLSRPQGHLTGLVTRGEDLTAKRLQILKEAFPRIRTVAVVGSNLSMSRVDFDEPARRLQLDILRFPVHRVDDYRDAAAAIARSIADAVLVVEDVDAVTNLTAFVRLMMATRRPVMFNADVFAEEYELTVNLRAAGEYAIVLPREFLLRADRVIR